MTISYGGINNFSPALFSIEIPQSIDAGIIRNKKAKSNTESQNEGNKILDFKTGQYVDYNEYLLKNAELDINYLA